MYKPESGELIIYINGNTAEIGEVKRVVNDGAYVYYSCGDTAAKTPFDCMYKLINACVIGENGLGGKML